ncbi:hypothetical protein Hanom_Chr04g00337001 [Helianthus anomalus]
MFRPEDIVDLCGVNLYLGSCDSTLFFDYRCVSWVLSLCLNVFCCMISQTMWFVCSPICCFAKIVLDVCVCLLSLVYSRYVCLSIVVFVWLYVMIALYFIFHVRDVVLVEYFARICVGYHSCLKHFFGSCLYVVEYMALLQVVGVVFLQFSC